MKIVECNFSKHAYTENMTNQPPAKPLNPSDRSFGLARRALTRLTSTSAAWRRRADAWVEERRRALALTDATTKRRSRDWDLDIDESEIL